MTKFLKSSLGWGNGYFNWEGVFSHLWRYIKMKWHGEGKDWIFKFPRNLEVTKKARMGRGLLG